VSRCNRWLCRHLKGFVARCAQALPIADSLGRGNWARKRECLQAIRRALGEAFSCEGCQWTVRRPCSLIQPGAGKVKGEREPGDCLAAQSARRRSDPRRAYHSWAGNRSIDRTFSVAFVGRRDDKQQLRPAGPMAVGPGSGL
jgi:hypothetical protein